MKKLGENISGEEEEIEPIVWDGKKKKVNRLKATSSAEENLSERDSGVLQDNRPTTKKKSVVTRFSKSIASSKSSTDDNQSERNSEDSPDESPASKKKFVVTKNMKASATPIDLIESSREEDPDCAGGQVLSGVSRHLSYPASPRKRKLV